jgi:hypothetical protein
MRSGRPFQGANMDNPRHVPHLHNYMHDPPSLMHSGAFHISNNMAASSTGPITPIYELPPSMMGQVSGDTVQQPSNAAMDYFDFDLSSFAMEGGLESTGITLDPVPEEIDLETAQIVHEQDPVVESRNRATSNGGTESIWSNNEAIHHGNPTNGSAQAAVVTGQQLHEQVSSRAFSVYAISLLTLLSMPYFTARAIPYAISSHICPT